MRKNKFLAALAIAACLATSVPFSVNAATPGQATDASKVKYGTVSTANQAVLKQLFDATYYKKNNPDLAAAGITTDDALFNHFVKCGVFEGRACCEGFNVSAYRCYPDLQAAFGDDIVAYYVHWKNFGQTEKRTLVTVEAAAAAGYTVKGVDGAVVSAPAAASTAAASTATSASTEKKEDTTAIPEGSKKAVFAENVKLDATSGLFYNASKKDNSKISTTLGINDGYVAVGGKYYKTVDKSEAVGNVDETKFGSFKKGAGSLEKTFYYDLNSKADTDLDAVEKGVPTTLAESIYGTYYIEVDGKFYPVIPKENAYYDNGGTTYTKVVVDNKDRYFVTAETETGFKYVPKEGYVKDENELYYEVKTVSGNTTQAELATYVKVDGEYVVKGSGAKASATNADKVALKGFVDFDKDKDFKNLSAAAKSNLTGIHEEVSMETALTYSENSCGKIGDTYYLKTALSESDVKSQKKLKANWTAKVGITAGGQSALYGYYKVVAESAVIGVKSGYDKTVKNGKDVYYKTVAIDATVATGPKNIAADGYVLVDGNAYKEVAFKDAFVEKEGYNVVKNSDDGLYYYVKK